MVVLNKATDMLMLVAKMLMLVMALHVVGDTLIRAFSSISLEGTIEIASNYYMVAILALPVAIVQRNKGHIVAEIFTQHMSNRGKLGLEAFGNILIVVFLAFIVWQSVLDAIEATANQEYVELTYAFLYVWPSKWFVPLGFGLMALYAFVQAISAFVALAAKSDRPI